MLSVCLNDAEFLCKRLDGCMLVGLTLEMKCKLLLPYEFGLPSLKELCLRDVEFDDGEVESVNEFIKGCPMVEILSLICCEVSSVRKLSIKCPFLKHLVLEKNWFSSGKNITILKLHAPNLESLKFVDDVACGYFISTFKSLSVAHVDVGPTAEHYQEGYYDDEVDDDPWKFYTDVSKIIVACSSTKQLYLTQCSIIALHYSSLQLPQFQNLAWLGLSDVTSEGWMVLACLLKNAPNLKRLGFEEAFLQSEMGFADFELLVPSLPVCLEKQLKRIVFRKFDVKGDEVKLLNVFLQNGKVLETVQFDSVEIAIKKQNDAVIAVDSSYASTSCGIDSPSSSSSSSHDSRLVDIIMQMEEQERAKRVKEQVDQFTQQSEQQLKQWTLVEQMMTDSLESKTPLSTMNLTMSELLESKEQLTMLNLSDMLHFEIDVLKAKESMILINQKMIDMICALMQREILPSQPPSTPSS